MSASAASANRLSASSAEWASICPLDVILPDTGVTALVAGRQIAVFHVAGRVFALGNRDPYSGADVLARGLIGERGGVLTVASPIYKQRFALDTGVCLDDPAVSVPVYACRVRDGIVEVAVSARFSPS
jgi:nitrite reductase (NADH) small subunit